MQADQHEHSGPKGLNSTTSCLLLQLGSDRSGGMALCNDWDGFFSNSPYCRKIHIILTNTWHIHGGQWILIMVGTVTRAQQAKAVRF